MTEDNIPQREMTFGEKAMGVNFNPGQNPNVATIEFSYANICDELAARRDAATNPEVKRMLSIAITELQTSQMWAVKAVTWQY